MRVQENNSAQKVSARGFEQHVVSIVLDIAFMILLLHGMVSAFGILVNYFCVLHFCLLFDVKIYISTFPTSITSSGMNDIFGPQ